MLLHQVGIPNYSLLFQVFNVAFYEQYCLLTCEHFPFLRGGGMLERMEEDRMPKKIFTQELEGTRRRGRPRKGLKEEVERDLPSAGNEKMERVGGR